MVGMIVVPLAIGACTGRDAPSGRDQSKLEAASRINTTTAAYFADAGLNNSNGELLGEILQSMHELPLQSSKGKASTEVLRFLYVRAFHPSIVVRVQPDGNECRVVTSMRGLSHTEFAPPDSNGLQLARVSHPGALLRRDSITIEMQSCDALRSRLADPAFWSVQGDSSDGGPDGSEWVFERADSHGHTAMSRWSPDSLTHCGLWTSGLEFLRLGNALPAKGDIY